MQPVYNQIGNVVGWVDEEGVLYELTHPLAAPLAYIENELIFTFSGICLGTYETGIFRDEKGLVVAFVEKSKSKVNIPAFLQIPPIPPIPLHKPIKYPQKIFSRPLSSKNWSGLDWSTYLKR